MKTKILNFISQHRLLVLMLLAVLTVPGLSNAAGEVGVKMDRSNTNAYLYDQYFKMSAYASWKKDARGMYYYCNEVKKVGPAQDRYSSYAQATPTLSAEQTRVLALGYPHVDIPEVSAADQKYYVTQMVYWLITNNRTPSDFVSNKYTASEKVLSGVKNLYNKVKASSTNYNYIDTQLSGPQSAKIDGNQYIAGPFTVTGTNIKSVDLTPIVNGIQGATFYSNNVQISKININQPFYVMFPVQSNRNSGSATLTLSGTRSYMIGLEYRSLEGRQNLGRYGLIINPVKLTSSISWDTPVPAPRPKIIEVCDIAAKKIISIDERDFDSRRHSKNLDDCKVTKLSPVEISKTDITTSAPLAGAKIEIFDSSNQLVYSAISDASGKIRTTLKPGTYTFKETVAPKGYLINTAIGRFTVGEAGVLVKANITDTPAPVKVVIIKRDIDSKKVLAGAQIEVKNQSGKIIYSGRTDVDGVANVGNLLPGKYTYKELQAPAGYQLNTNLNNFEIKIGDKTKTLYIENKVVPPPVPTPVQIIKVDIDTNKPLAGAKIEVYNSLNKRIFAGITASDGAVQLGKLAEGLYYYKEIEAPAGYELNTEKHSFVLAKNQKEAKLYIKNKRIPNSQVEISKTELTTSEPVPGATIVIKNNNGEIVYQAISDTEGKIKTTLAPGVYTFEETVAPEGYILNKEVGKFEVGKEGKIVKAELKNKRIPVTPPTITKVELPHTGPAEVIISVVALGAIMTSIMYFIKSIKALK